MSQADFIKTACQACEGRLELPVDSVGVAFACPRCGAKLKLTLKCACINCGGPLSFEVGHIGHTIQCGHCEGSTPLMPSAIVIHDTPTEKESEPELEPKPEPELELELERWPTTADGGAMDVGVGPRRVGGVARGTAAAVHTLPAW